ncbi:MAG: AAA family ATPase [Burkholderiaceae bacterium]
MSLEKSLGETPSRETQQLVALIEAAITLPVAPPPQPVAVLRPPRLVGRESEWLALTLAHQRAVPVLVLGEPGIGKSRLLGDFCEASGISLKIAARPGDDRVPYTLMSRLLREVWAAAAAAPPWDSWVSHELARIVPEIGPAATGRVDLLRLRRAIESALAGYTARGVLLDDLQFADDASLELLPALVAAAHSPWWLLGSRRSELPQPIRTWLDGADTGAVVSIELPPFGRAAVADLLESLDLPRFAPPEWAERLYRHTGGHPLFLLETLMALGQSERAQGAAPGELPLPRNASAMIERRLAALSPTALKLSRIAALAGVDFSVDLAAQILDVHPIELTEPWRELEAALVMQGWSFAHDMVQESARAGVPAPVRCWLHERIAQVLSRAESEVAPARLAHHWREGGQHLRAADCFHRAAAAVRAIGRVADECRLLRSAAESFGLAGAQQREFDVLIELVVATREAQGTAHALLVAAELAAKSTNDGQRAVAFKETGVCHLHAMQYGLAASALAQAIECAQAAADTENENHARYLLALARVHTDGAAQSAKTLVALLPWAEAHADESFRNCYLADMAIMLDQSDQRRQAVPLFERAIKFFDQGSDPSNLAAAHTMLGRCLQALGQAHEAAQHGELALRARSVLSEGAGGQGIEALNLGRSLCELGRYAEVLDLLQPENDRLVIEGVLVPAAAMRLVMARVHFHLAQDARALQLLDDMPEPLAFNLRAMLLWTRSLGARSTLERQTLLDQALACFAENDQPSVRLPIALDQVSGLEGEAALQRCQALVDECVDRELLAAAMLGRVRLLGMRHVRGRLGPAHELAASLVDGLPGSHPVNVYIPELYVLCRRAAFDAGDLALAQRCLDSAVEWIKTRALPNVPEPFRDSFLHRNAVNRELLALAANQARR